MQKLIILGNNITADILYKYVERDERYEITAFCADAEFIKTEEQHGHPVIEIARLKENYSPDNYTILAAIGYQKLNHTRADLFRRVKEMGYSFETYIHPDAHVFSDEVGEGTIILPGSVVEPHAQIEDNSMIWANCTIAHHAKIGSHCWVASGTVIAGEAVIDDYCFLGVNTTIANQVKVSKNNLIGAHSSIQKNTAENEVYLTRQAEKHRFSALDYAEHILK